MQGIEFDEDKNYRINTGADRENTPAQPSSMAKLVFKMGVNDPSAANFVLLGVAAIFFGVAIFLYAGILSEPRPIKMTASQQLEQGRLLMEMQSPRQI